MAESVVLTKSLGGDFQIVVGGMYSYTKQFPVANYSTSSLGVKLNVPAHEPKIMFKEYLPAAWTVGVATGFATNKEVTDAITALSAT